ncbi:hypothetical protein ISCGN_022154 [Ixodes scapularis]
MYRSRSIFLADCLADVHGYSGSGDGGAGGTLVAAARCHHGVYGVGPGHCCPPANQPGPLSNGGAAETGLNPGGAVPADCAESYSSTDCSDCDEEDEEDDDDYEESLTCNVCERSFNNGRQLSQHQQRKRHYGCSVCDAIFPTLMALEHHKESLEHWSDEEPCRDHRRARTALRRRRNQDEDEDDDDDDDEDDDDDDDEDTDSDSDLEPGPKSQELERLL